MDNEINIIEANTKRLYFTVKAIKITEVIIPTSEHNSAVTIKITIFVRIFR